MSNLRSVIAGIEDRVERALWELEVRGAWQEALNVYREAYRELAALDVAGDPQAERERQRALAYCLMRMRNLLRQLGQREEASKLAEEELAAARASGDAVTLGRSLMSHGVDEILGGDLDRGLAELEEARQTFESGGSKEHLQGLGWYWILQAELRNAGVIPADPHEVIAAANRALELLLPIENWPGVARAYRARARAHESLGDRMAAEADRAHQERYERLIQDHPPRRD